MVNNSEQNSLNIQAGFTLLELVIVTTIIAILSTLAYVKMSQLQDASFDLHALSAIKDLISAQEANYVDTDYYVSCAQLSENSDAAGTNNLPSCSDELESFTVSNATVTITANEISDGHAFTASSCSSRGSYDQTYDDNVQINSRKVFTFSNEDGVGKGIQEGSADFSVRPPDSPDALGNC